VAGGPVPAVGIVVAAFVSGAIGLVLAAVAWRRRDTRGARQFLWFVLAQSAWATAAGLVWLSPTFRVALAFETLTHVFALGSLVSWVVFVVTYTGRQDSFRGWPRRLFFGWAAGFLVLLATNPATELLFAGLRPASFQGLTLVRWTPTDLLLANFVVIYGAILWTYWLLVRFATSAIGGEGRQALVILGADLVFVGINFGYYTGGYSLHPELDPSPIFFTATVVIVGVALFVYDFLDFEPVAASLVVEEMTDPVVVRYDSRGPVPLNDPASKLVPSGADSLAEACPALAAALDAGESTIALDFDGDERVFDLNVSPIRTHSDRKRGDLLVLRDITVQKRREQELERQNERLDAFADAVSHDLRNPLNVASGRVELAGEECDSHHLHDAGDALDRMGTLIDDLLTLAREGEAVGEVEPVDLTALTETCWTTVATDGAVLRADPGLTVRADRSRLRQLLENLFRNAVEHSSTSPRSEPRGDAVEHGSTNPRSEPRGDAVEHGSAGGRPGSDDDVEHGGTTVTVGALPDERGFYVADNGPGVPEADREQVFESGFSTTDEGTGFGLAIVAEIAEAHGWTISVTDAEGGGARFEIVTTEAAAADRG